MRQEVAQQSQSSGASNLVVVFVALAIGAYFAIHAIQGEYGHLNRVQIEAEEERLSAELAVLKAELADLENKTRRLSDGFLDLDLLDERARDVLGVLRPVDLVLE